MGGREGKGKGRGKGAAKVSVDCELISAIKSSSSSRGVVREGREGREVAAEGVYKVYM